MLALLPLVLTLLVRNPTDDPPVCLRYLKALNDPWAKSE